MKLFACAALAESRDDECETRVFQNYIWTDESCEMIYAAAREAFEENNPEWRCRDMYVMEIDKAMRLQ